MICFRKVTLTLCDLEDLAVLDVNYSYGGDGSLLGSGSKPMPSASRFSQAAELYYRLILGVRRRPLKLSEESGIVWTTEGASSSSAAASPGWRRAAMAG